MDYVYDKETSTLLDTYPCDKLDVSLVEQFWQDKGYSVYVECNHPDNKGVQAGSPISTSPSAVPPNPVRVKQQALTDAMRKIGILEGDILRDETTGDMRKVVVGHFEEADTYYNDNAYDVEW